MSQSSHQGLLLSSCWTKECVNATKSILPVSPYDFVLNNNDYVLADIDGVVIIPSNMIENILQRAEKLISTENLVRKSIREGMDPQEAYLKYSVF